jgi:hypothetical protein
MAAKKIILFIEGGSDSSNGDLRQGFSKLLAKKVAGNMPRINLGGGKAQTIQKFLKNKLKADLTLLLLDLDSPEQAREADLEANNLSAYHESVFYMIQEMEAWFLSQPEILDGFFGPDDNGKKVSDKLPKQKAIEIIDPKNVLKNATKKSKKGEYHEIKHGVELLKLLDLQKLEDTFADFQKLISRLIS